MLPQRQPPRRTISLSSEGGSLLAIVKFIVGELGSFVNCPGVLTLGPRLWAGLGTKTVTAEGEGSEEEDHNIWAIPCRTQYEHEDTLKTTRWCYW